MRQRHGLPRGDLDRVVRQQVYLAGLLRNVLSTDVLFDLGKQKAIVEQVGSSVTFDRELDLFDLAAQLQNVRPGSITFQTVPGLAEVRIDGADVLQPPSEEEVRAFFATLSATSPEMPASGAPTDEAPAVQPGDVTVSVLNGSGVTGAAATAAATLTDAGFVASSGGNASSTGTTTVRHHSGDEAAAALVAAQVPGAPVTVDESCPQARSSWSSAVTTGIGQAVTGQAPTNDGGSAGNERTATDSSCIY